MLLFKSFPSHIQRKVSLKEFNSWKVGGEAEYFCQPTNFSELETCYAWAVKKKKPVTVLSGGSNVLISDRGVKGLLIQMREMKKVEPEEIVDGNLRFSVWAGAQKSEALKVFLKYKLSPALFLAGLPGDIGGGVVMNAGVGEQICPREFCEITDWVEVLQPNGLVKVSATDIQWNYRSSSGWQPGVITRVGLKWPNEADADIMKKIKEATKNRIMRQPLNLPSCGSTFRNPKGGKSGQLIESCGLKGFQIGGAQVSPKHANFIVTQEGATAADVKAIIQHVQQTVLDETGFKLETEVVYMGSW